jgi:DJ-1/PfpI family
MSKTKSNRAERASPASAIRITSSRRNSPSRRFIGSSGMSPFNVGFVIFPELTQLDFTGPQQVLARLPQSAMHIIAKTTEPVPSDSGLSLVPTHTFENSPRLDLICIPGGNKGVVQALGDRDTIEFVRRQSSTARYVTSVCTGAFILGVAGLLKGRRATTHWAFLGSAWWPRLPARQLLRQSNWASSMIRTRHLMPAIPIGRPIPSKRRSRPAMSRPEHHSATD